MSVARTILLTPTEHNAIVAATRHLSYLVAAILMGTVAHAAAIQVLFATPRSLLANQRRLLDVHALSRFGQSRPTE